MVLGRIPVGGRGGLQRKVNNCFLSDSASISIGRELPNIRQRTRVSQGSKNVTGSSDVLCLNLLQVVYFCMAATSIKYRAGERSTILSTRSYLLFQAVT